MSEGREPLSVSFLSASDVSRRLDASLHARGAQPTEDQLVLAPYIRASSIGRCGRQIVLASSVQLENTLTPESSLAMLQGDWGEEGMVRLLAASGYSLRDRQRELNFYDKDGNEVIRGHIDGILEVDHGPLGKESSLWETKMMSAFRFRKLAAATVEETSPEYYAQTQLYMWLLRNDGETLTDCIFTGIAKDPSAANMGIAGPRLNPIYVERIPFDEAYAEALVDRALGLFFSVHNGGDWPRERINGIDWDCSEKFCPVFSICAPPAVAKPPRARKAKARG